MIKDPGSAIRVPHYTKDFIDNLRSTRRTKINGISVDNKQLTQVETQLLLAYYFAEHNERYKELINIRFPKELRMRLIKIDKDKNV